MKIKHIISLGYFCSPALELERFGYRDSSYPFDWLIIDFPVVVRLINNHFDEILQYDNMSQKHDMPYLYRDDKYNIEFYHDFNKYQPLSKQLNFVRDKYLQRIKRFYDSIHEPTLFVRYISDEHVDEEGKSLELKWIEENFADINSLIKSFNANNRILYISNFGQKSKIVDLFFVTKDLGDTVCRKPFENNSDIPNYILNFEYDSFLKARNLDFYYRKLRRAKRMKIWNRLVNKLQKIFYKEYHHNKTY
jgi:hypothetical protein